MKNQNSKQKLPTPATLSLSVLTCALALTISPIAHAAVLYEAPNDTQSNTFLVGYTIGASFTVGASDVSVSHLGIYDQGSNGLVGTYDLGLWSANDTTTPLAQVSISGGTSATAINYFQYTSLATPITLVSGETYYIGAFYGSAADGWGDSPSLPAGISSSFVNYVGRVQAGPSLTFPTISGQPGAPYTAINFQYSVIPEPANAASLAAMALLAFAGLQRRRKALEVSSAGCSSIHQ
jgi:uncharacterized protein (TIGR03382 family)